MSARDDYRQPSEGGDVETFDVMCEELDWLRNSVGELLARLATVATPDEWKRPI